MRPLEAIFFKTARSGIYRDDVDRLTRWRYAHAGLDAAAVAAGDEDVLRASGWTPGLNAVEADIDFS